VSESSIGDQLVEGEFLPQLRLHRVSWLFALTKLLRQLLVPLFALVFFGIRDDWSIWVVLATVPMLAAALWRQWLYRYGFADRGLVIRDGWFFRSTRQIDYPRIENIATHQNLLHRLLDVAEVRVETSTGGSAEATISVLGTQAVQELRDQLFDRSRAAGKLKAQDSQPLQPSLASQSGQPNAPASADAQVLLHLGPAELVRFGLTTNRGMFVVLATTGFYSQTGLPKETLKGLEARFESLPWQELFVLGWFTQVLVGLALMAAAVAVMRSLSIMLAFVTLHDFTLRRTQQDLQINCGLLTQLAFVLRAARIQVVRQRQSLLQRLMGRVSLSIDLTGSLPAVDQSKERNSVRWLAPICTLPHSRELIAAALPSLDLSEEPDWQPLADGAHRRMTRTSLLLLLPLSATPTFFFARNWTPLVVIGVAAWMWWWCRERIRHTRWALTSQALYVQSGWLTRKLVIAPRDRLQVARISISPFDRRWNMATVWMDTAGAILKPIYIPYLPATTAQWLADELYGTPVRDLKPN
jgi:putative membrane protein